jgi:membrane protein DedA with SNARE-associated domain
MTSRHRHHFGHAGAVTVALERRRDMSLTVPGDAASWITAYGYWAVAAVVALESMGLPMPGEATLIAAAILAGTAHALDIWFVVAAAAAGAILGDNVGFLVGREIGFRLLVRYGGYIGLTEARIKLGQYLFLRHGGKVVFFGRFVAVLRVLAAFLAGVNCMSWPRFLVFNAAGGLVWAASYGFGAWYLGKQLSRIAEPAEIALVIIAVIALAAGFLFLRRHEAQLQQQAEAALPGPLRRGRRLEDPRQK